MATPQPKNVHQVDSLDAFNAFVLTAPDALHVVFCWAAFHEPSKPGGQMDTVVNKLSEVHPTVHFAKVRTPGLVGLRECGQHA
jgi:hypothetical protein